MKIWKLLILVGIAGLLTLGFLNLSSKKEELDKEIQKLAVDLDDLKKENASLSSSLEYFKESKNLLKELKSQFNYVESGEKLIIVVPKQNNSTSTRD